MNEKTPEYKRSNEDDDAKASLREAQAAYLNDPQDRTARREFLRALLDDEFDRMEPSLRYLADR